jgi:quercetin 2,3-dioxygenase
MTRLPPTPPSSSPGSETAEVTPSSELSRRNLIFALTGTGLGLGCARTQPEPAPRPLSVAASPVLLERLALQGPPWPTFDPFLFCVHHNDAYPRGTAGLGPAASLAGRRLGSDFSALSGWSMYHGEEVPGFPRHPHRGFETVTITRRGTIDHSDSLGARARYGGGDVQWMTAGRGIVHAEMFPLLSQQANNPLELFQIWLNLPQRNKFVEPYFSMFWKEKVPVVRVLDAERRVAELTLIAGHYGNTAPPAPPPHSWASDVSADLAIWSIRLAPGAHFELPAAQPTSGRTLYAVSGGAVALAGGRLEPGVAFRLAAGSAVTLVDEGRGADLLLLQGRPIGEPVVQRGPFVMNEPAEIVQAYRDYQRTGFGGWPWPADGPTHGASPDRFAHHADGRFERA